MVVTNIGRGMDYHTDTIANGAATSSGVDLLSMTLNGLLLPAMTSTSITFEVSVDGSNYYTLHDSDKTALTVTCDGTARAFYLEPVKFAGFRFVRAVAASNEAAQRTLTFIGVQAISDGS